MVLWKTLISFVLITSLWNCVQGQPEKAVVNGVGSIFEAIGFSPACVSRVLADCEKNAEDPSFFDEQKNQLKSLQEAIEKLHEQKKRPRNCWDILELGDKESGVRTVYPFDCCKKAVSVFCDQTTDEGGWTVIQHRDAFPHREDFFRKWNEYKLGFGQLTAEFWLGLDNIHALVSNTLMELRIDLQDFEGEKRWAKYDYFYIADAADKYRIDVGKYSGNAGDGFKDRHIGYPFSTKDKDNDSYEKNCAELFRGGWWYDKCHISNLNGFQHQGKHTSHADGINWYPWHGHKYSLKKTSIALRPKFPSNVTSF